MKVDQGTLLSLLTTSCLSFILVFISSTSSVSSSPLKRSFAPESDALFGPGFSSRSKKPFCNAFTGCGRKRSDPGTQEQHVSEKQLWDLLAAKLKNMRARNSQGGEFGFLPGQLRKRRDVEEHVLDQVKNGKKSFEWFPVLRLSQISQNKTIIMTLAAMSMMFRQFIWLSQPFFDAHEY